MEFVLILSSLVYVFVLILSSLIYDFVVYCRNEFVLASNFYKNMNS